MSFPSSSSTPQRILDVAKRDVEDAGEQVSQCETSLNHAVEGLALAHDRVTYWEEITERTAGLTPPPSPTL